MKLVLKNFIIFSVLTLLVLSCSKEQIVPKYYVLEPVREIQITAAEKIPVTVVIKPFYVSGIYNQKRIVFRNDSNELQYYFYHMWAEKPSVAIRYFLKDYFENAELFNNCYINSYLSDAEYFIKGNIDKIERVKGDDTEFISLKMSFNLVKAADGKIAVNHSFSKKKPIKEGIGMNVFAQEISAILTEEANSFLNQIESYFKQQEH